MRECSSPCARFGIKAGYSHRPAPDYYSDNPERHEAGVVWQPEVYETAARLAEAGGCKTVIDIGCGNASKLVALHPRFEIVGVDFGSNLDYCRSRYPEGNWVEANLETVEKLPIEESVLRGGIVVCSDVIEHLVDPMPLLRTIREMLEVCAYAVISTPDRNLIRGKQHTGPPDNPHHVREWALPELRELVLSVGIEPIYSGLTLTHNQSTARNTILIVARGSGGPVGEELLPPRVSGFTYQCRAAKRSFDVWRTSLSGDRGSVTRA